MSSGIKVDSGCLEAYTAFKMKKMDAFFIMGFSDDLKRIEVKHVQKKDPNSRNSIAEKSKNRKYSLARIWSNICQSKLVVFY